MHLGPETKKLTIREWMDKNGISNLDFCREIGCCETTVIHWKNGVYIPHKFHKAIIKRITNDEVEI